MDHKAKTEQSASKMTSEVVGWFSEQAYSQITQEKISMARNMSLGSAGLSVLAIFRLSLAPELSVSLYIALFSFCIAAPLFVAIAFWYEIFIWLGEESYEYLSFKRAKTDRWALIPMSGLFVGVLAIIWHLSAFAALMFIITSIVALYVLEQNVAGIRSSFLNKD